MSLPPPSSLEIEEFTSRLALLDGLGDTVDDGERIRAIGAMERAKAALCAAQARVSVAFDASQRQAQRDAGLPSAKVGTGIAEQVALARQESPAWGSRHLGLAKALVHELPHTLSAVTSGQLSEWRAILIAQATAVLLVADRAEVDRRLAGRLAGLSDKQVRAAALAAAYELDPRSVVDRAAYAVTQRRVTMRPAPDTMAYLTALLPAAQAVAVFAALHAAAGSARSAGDTRTSDQVKADTLVERVTGQSTADAVSVEIGLVMSDATLIAGGSTPAHLVGYGPIPAAHARQIAAGPQDSGLAETRARAWVRRLYLDPATQVMTTADATRRRFPEHLRQLVVARDQWCRTPWCGAPIRHIDHARAFFLGGPTSLANAQGLCERCNHAKESLGWATEVDTSGAAPLVTTTTPTGARHTTSPPAWAPAQEGPLAQSA
jgi:hypothetical protein